METHIVLLDPGCVNVRIWARSDAHGREVATTAARDLGLTWDGGFCVDLGRQGTTKPPATNYEVLGNTAA